MRVSLTSGAFVEAAVTLAVAVLMTFAGFEMLEELPAFPTHDVAIRAHPAVAAAPPDERIAMPHVDERRA
jgi:hypothetical protein